VAADGNPAQAGYQGLDAFTLEWNRSTWRSPVHGACRRQPGPL